MLLSDPSGGRPADRQGSDVVISRRKSSPPSFTDPVYEASLVMVCYEAGSHDVSETFRGVSDSQYEVVTQKQGACCCLLTWFSTVASVGDQASTDKLVTEVHVAIA